MTEPGSVFDQVNTAIDGLLALDARLADREWHRDPYLAYAHGSSAACVRAALAALREAAGHEAQIEWRKGRDDA